MSADRPSTDHTDQQSDEQLDEVLESDPSTDPSTEPTGALDALREEAARNYAGWQRAQADF